MFDNTALLRIVYEGFERRDIDYKRSMPWDNSTKFGLVKDIMAFANFGGGNIVVGVDEKEKTEDKKFTGVSIDHKRTWEVTQVNRDINNYCNPGIDIDCIDVKDERRNVTFLLIRVPSHESTPHVCSQDKHDASNKHILRKCAVYYRTRNKSCEEISDLQDYQELIRRCLLNDKGRLLTDFERIIQGVSSSTSAVTERTLDPLKEMDSMAKVISEESPKAVE